MILTRTSFDRHFSNLSLEMKSKGQTLAWTQSGMIITIEMAFEFIQSEPNRSNVAHRFMICSSAGIFQRSGMNKQSPLYGEKEPLENIII